MRLIDADILKAKVPNTNVDIFENCRNCNTLMDWQVKELIDKMPTIDAVEVVRCRNCKWFAEFTHNGEPTGHGSCNNPQNGWGRCPQADWFCKDGKRRTE